VLAIVIGVPPVTAGRDNLENPDPLNIAEFAIEHDESHQGSASDIRQARTPELALALGCQSEWFESGSAILRACAQRPMMTTCCHSSARVAHAVENVSVLALFFGRSSPEHCAGAFSRVWGNLPMVLMLLPASPAVPSGDSIESDRGLTSRRKPLVQLDPFCDPCYALAHRCRKGTVTVTAAYSMQSPWSPCAF
jgi:hypothetical protein